MKSKRKRVLIDEQKFFELYEQGKTWSDIAREMGVSVATISLFAKKRGIKSNFKYKKEGLDIIKKLHAQGLTDSEIARQTGFSSSKVQENRSTLGLTVNRINQNLVPTQRQLELMVGGFLGDSFLTKGKYGISGGFAHATAQEEYFYWKYNQLSDLCGVVREDSLKDKRTKKEYFRIATSFKRAPYLDNLYDVFYGPQGRSLQNKEFIYDNFSEYSLAVWMGDDGSWYNLATYSYCLDDRIFLVKLLEEKVGVPDVGIRKDGVLGINKRSRERIGQLCESLLPESMHYKFIKQ